jgi:hypothetical protein
MHDRRSTEWRRTGRLGLLAGVLLAVGCRGASSSAQQQQPEQPSQQGGAVHAAAGAVKLGVAPVTVKLKGGAGVAKPFVVRFDGLRAGPGQSAILRVFAGLPSATVNTPVSDPHFAGILTLLAISPTAAHSINALLELKHELAAPEELTLTIVPVTADGKVPAALDASIDEIAQQL